MVHRTKFLRPRLFLSVLWLLGCTNSVNVVPSETDASGKDTTTDGDADTDTDGDSDTDSDVDSETVSDEPPPSSDDSDFTGATDSESDESAIGDTATADTDSDTDTDAEPDGDSDADADTDTDTDTDTDSDTDTDTDGDSDSATDTENDTGTEAPVPVEQHTVEIEVVNMTDTVKYLNNFSDGNFMEIDRLDGNTWHPFITQNPPCTANCESVEAGEACCRAEQCIDDLPSIFVLQPDDWVKHYWDGELFEPVSNHCSDCDCAASQPVLTGTYRARICAYDAMTCDPPAACDPPPPTGYLPFGEVAGDSTCYAEEFQIFYEDDYIRIEISEETIVVV